MALVQDYQTGDPIYYGLYEFCDTPILLAATEKGVCALWFLQEDLAEAISCLERDFKTLVAHMPEKTDFFYQTLLNGEMPPLVLKGTEFQKQVWKALRELPKEQTATYSDIAKTIGQPKAVRAVASAIAKNKIAYLVPCHRILPKSGGIGNYRWGRALKEKLLS